MNERKYRLIRGKHFRTVKQADGPETLVRFEPGDVLVPTDTELKILRGRIEGPVDDEAEISDGANPNTPLKPKSEVPAPVSRQVEEDIKMSAENLREVIRTADKDYLMELAQLEGLRKPKPRPAVIEMLERRLKAIG